MKFKITASILAGVMLVSAARAVNMGPGSGTFSVSELNPVGATTVFSTNVSWGASFSFSGTLTSSVVTNDSSNPFGLNDLTFIYQFSINSNSGPVHPGTGFSVGNFSTFSTDVSYLAGTGIAPFTFNRSGESPTEGDTLAFSFAQILSFTVVAPGTNSAMLVVQTDATQWAPSISSIIDSSAFPDIATLAPVDAVPEPTTIALTGFGALAFAALKRRQNNFQKAKKRNTEKDAWYEQKN